MGTGPEAPILGRLPRVVWNRMGKGPSTDPGPVMFALPSRTDTEPVCKLDAAGSNPAKSPTLAENRTLGAHGSRFAGTRSTLAGRHFQGPCTGRER